MARIAVLGAGYMGGAITIPLAQNGHEVRLWGTWLDDEIVAACRAGPHPKLRKPLPRSVKLFPSPQLAEAVEGADFIFIAVASKGFLPVFERLLACLSEEKSESKPFFSLTKGFIPVRDRVWRVSECAGQLYRISFPDSPFLWASIGGPVKAVELADAVPTTSVYAINDPALAEFLPSFRTRFYRVVPGWDLIGLELCSALKNGYASLLGICDGLYKKTPGRFYDNIKAFLLVKSIEELAMIVGAAGGKPETAFGLPGAGDLYVTSQSGRNRKYGELVGGGTDPEKAYALMLEAGETAEGYPAVRNGLAFIRQLGSELPERLPVFRTLQRILFEKAPAEAELDRLVQGYP